ncbi:hypothetical protein SK128_009404 [Halocaridina rubra]|uniref:Uncharacterized protein n=1 Tax=Halocaridina rubra TaxID=373956 RepID=A0AAN8XKX2_HALRR
MRILVVLMMAAAICWAEDDSAERFDSGEVSTLRYTSIPSKVVYSRPVPLPTTVTKTTLNTAPIIPASFSTLKTLQTIPAPIATLKTVQAIPAPIRTMKTVPAIPAPIPTPETYASVPSTVAYAESLSPAVMKIPKPGIRFNVPVPHVKMLETVPIPVPEPISVIPKTTIKTVEVPATPVTLKSIPAPVTTAVAPVSLLRAFPEATLMPAETPVPAISLVEDIFEDDIESLPVQYWSTPIGRQLPAFTVPSQTINAVSPFAQVPTTVPISYSTTAEIPVPAVGTSVVQTLGMKPQKTFAYWGDITTPQQLTDIVDLGTGSFSYTNFIGGPSILGLPLPLLSGVSTQGHSLKATESLIPQTTVPVKATAPVSSVPQGKPAVIAA